MKTLFSVTILLLITINCFSQSALKRNQKKASPQTKTATINPAIKRVTITKTHSSSNNRTSKLIDTALLKNRAIKPK